MSRRRHRRGRSKAAQKLPDLMGRLVMAFRYDQAMQTDWMRWVGAPVAIADARRAVEEGKAEKVVRRCEDGIVRAVGIRWRAPLRPEKPSPTTLTFRTMRAVSGEWNGDALGTKPTDTEEREIKGFMAHPFRAEKDPRTGDDLRPYRAGLVLPRVSGRDIVAAQKMFDRARGVKAKPLNGRHSSRQGEVRTWHATEGTTGVCAA